MGLQYSVYVGAFVQAWGGSVTYQGGKACPNNHVIVGSDAEFCPRCGVQLEPFDRVRRATLYDLIPEHEDVLWELPVDEEYIVAIGNMQRELPDCVGHFSDSAAVRPINLEVAGEYVANFAVNHAEVLKVLQERANRVEVKFGVLAWWY